MNVSETAAARALFASAVDYAGLFPPAKLPMDAAVRAYAAARAGRHAWMLGRFVLPAARADEFIDAAGPSLGAGAWPLSLLVGDAEAAARAIAKLREACAARVRVAGLEVAPYDAAAIASSAAALSAAALPHDVEICFEVPAGAGRAERLDAVARAGACAKVRTGGVTADAFPPLHDLRDFLLDCARRRLSFKATAGLHHACRAAYRLTYEPDGPSGVMHGFVNVAVAAALAWSGASAGELDAALADARPTAWLTREALVWRARTLDAAALAECRQRFFRSFGSCSFDEPADELYATPLS
jgi:hypothetical protein